MKHLLFVFGAVCMLTTKVLAVDVDNMATQDDSWEIIQGLSNSEESTSQLASSGSSHATRSKDGSGKYLEGLKDAARHQMPHRTRNMLNNQPSSRVEAVRVVLEEATQWTEDQIIQAPGFFADVGLTQDEMEEAVKAAPDSCMPLVYLLRLRYHEESALDQTEPSADEISVVFENDAHRAVKALHGLLEKNYEKLYNILLSVVTRDPVFFHDLTKASFDLELFDVAAKLVERMSGLMDPFDFAEWAIEHNQSKILERILLISNVRVLGRIFEKIDDIISNNQLEIFKSLCSYRLEVTQNMVVLAASKGHAQMVKAILENNRKNFMVLQYNSAYLTTPDVMNVILQSEKVYLSNDFLLSCRQEAAKRNYNDLYKTLSERAHVPFS